MKANINGHWATVAGMRGKSAYEQAVEAGFEGSKEEFTKGLSNTVEIPSKKGEAENSYVEGGYNGEISIKNINLSSRENSLTDFIYDAKEDTLNVGIVQYVIDNRIPVTTLIPEYDGDDTKVINIVGFKTVTCEEFNSADNTLRFSGPLSNSDFTNIPFSF